EYPFAFAAIDRVIEIVCARKRALEAWLRLPNVGLHIQALTGAPCGTLLTPPSQGRSDRCRCEPRSFAPKWRNWQTRKFQVFVSARTCRFKSCLRHHFLINAGSIAESLGQILINRYRRRVMNPMYFAPATRR